MRHAPLHFTGILTKEGKQFVGICPELDVSSFGATKLATKKHLEEAVTLHIESSIESNLPYLRPIPKTELPRRVIDTFSITADLKVFARAA